MTLFYVYEHWRPDRDECFYVGKGQARRANDMHRGRNRFHHFIQAKLSRLGLAVEVKIVASGLSEEEAFALERERIAMWRSDGADLCNMSAGGEGPSGLKHTEEWKRANSERMKGRAVSEETRQKLSEAAIGNQRGLGSKRSAEAIKRTAAAHRGKKRSPEHCAKMSAARKGKPGKPHTQDAIDRIRAKQIGRPKSEATRAAMRKPKSEEHKRKLSEINMGKTHTADTRRLLSEKAKADWAKRKAKRMLEYNSSSVR